MFIICKNRQIYIACSLSQSYTLLSCRHVDTPNLYVPDVENPSDGLFVIAHNFVNAIIDESKYKYGFKHGSAPKSFCVSTLSRLNIHGCNGDGNSLLLNHHYNDIKAGDVFVVAKDAAYFTPHKAEGVNKGHSSLTMSRNYH